MIEVSGGATLADFADLGLRQTGARPGPATLALKRLRTQVSYAWRHHKLVDIDAPQRFTEWVQWRKYHDHDPRFPMLADKLRVKAHVARVLGDAWVTPTLWHGTVLPDVAPWAPGYVVKSRHGCNQSAFVRTGDEDWDAIRRASARWLERDYGRWLDEWLYREIPRGIMVEPFIGAGGVLPVDYKVYVFAGQVAAIQCHTARETAHAWALYAPDWQRLTSADAAPATAPPASLAAMLDAAATLGRDHDFVRVDFYDVGGQARFGEMTFYPGSGFDRFAPVTLDDWLGALWRGARAR